MWINKHKLNFFHYIKKMYLLYFRGYCYINICYTLTSLKKITRESPKSIMCYIYFFLFIIDFWLHHFLLFILFIFLIFCQFEISRLEQ